jgi:chemotaxis response regulator CheB
VLTLEEKVLAASQFPVVGIGASAGGIEALEGFFRGLPSDDPGVAIVIVTHLGPDRKSLLHEVVDRYTDLEVRVVEQGAKIEVNTVYILSMTRFSRSKIWSSSSERIPAGANANRSTYSSVRWRLISVNAPSV